MRKLAIIPARVGSKRIPRKNIKNFLSQPILSYSIKAAYQAKLFDEVMVSTDDEEISELAQYYDASVPFLRSKKNASDTATTVDVLIEVLQEYQKKGVSFTHACCIYPTAPLMSPFSLRLAYKKMISQKFDCVLPVTEFNYPIHRALSVNNEGQIKMVNEQNSQTRTQDLPKAYHDAGQFYWFNVKKLLEQKTLFTENTGSIILPEYQVQDIDTEVDWKMAELKFRMLNSYNENKNFFPSIAS